MNKTIKDNFGHEIQVGDYVITYNSVHRHTLRKYIVSKVTLKGVFIVLQDGYGRHNELRHIETVVKLEEVM